MGRRPIGTGPKRPAVESEGLVPEYSDESDSKTPELPEDWQELFDAESGDMYFWNSKTGETTWDRPVAVPTPTAAAEPNVESVVAQRNASGVFDLISSEIDILDTHEAGMSTRLLTIADRVKANPGADMSKVEFSIEVRVRDWRDGGLSVSFLCRRLKEIQDQLDGAVPIIAAPEAQVLAEEVTAVAPAPTSIQQAEEKETSAEPAEEAQIQVDESATVETTVKFYTTELCH